MTRRPHLLLIAMFFPPSRASGVYRPLGIANDFAARGWDVTVLTVDEAFFEEVTESSDPELLAKVDARVEIKRVRFSRPEMRLPGAQPTVWSKVKRKAFGARSRLRRLRAFPDKYWAWIAPATAAAQSIHAKHPVDITLATGNPWSAFRIAQAFSERCGVPYVMDYRDSWTLDQFSESEAFAVDSPQNVWEERLMRDASRIVFVNAPMEEWHAQRHPAQAQKMIVVENGFDPEVIGEIPFRAPQPNRPLDVGYVGTITRMLPHEVSWEGWQLARRSPELADATVHLYGHMGFFPRDIAEVRALIPLDDGVGVVWEGAVSKSRVADAYASLDIIMMMIPSSRFVTAGKVYETMFAGRPIVAIHTPETAATGPLTGYPLWFPVAELSPEAVRDALVRAAVAARSVTPEQAAACRAHADQYRRSELLEPLEADLRALAGIPPTSR